MSVRSVVAELDFAEPSRRGALRRPAGRAASGVPTRGEELESALLVCLLRQPGLGVAVCAPDGVLTTANEALVHLLGRDPLRDAPFTLDGAGRLRDARGQRVRRGQDPLTRALRGQAPGEERFSVVDERGRSIRQLDARAFPLLSADGTVLGAALVARDVSETLHELNRLEDLRADLVDTVNHEVRTPLAVITGHLELIEDRSELASEGLRWSLRAIGRATQQLRTVVEGISGIIEESRHAVPDQRR